MVAKNTYMGLTEKEIEITFKKIGLYGLNLLRDTVLEARENCNDDWDILNNAYENALSICEEREQCDKPINVQQKELIYALEKLSKKELPFIKEFLLIDPRADEEPNLGDPYHEMRGYVEHEEISRPARKTYKKVISKELRRATRLETNQQKKLLRLSYEG